MNQRIFRVTETKLPDGVGTFNLLDTGNLLKRSEDLLHFRIRRLVIARNETTSSIDSDGSLEIFKRKEKSQSYAGSTPVRDANISALSPDFERASRDGLLSAANLQLLK